MITLITGTPGTGKTAWVVAALRDFLRAEDKQAASDPAYERRRVFTDGIPDLTLEVESAEDINGWHEWAPDRALIVVDEVQRVWRPRSAGSKVPESVAQLETHRHKGIDIWLLTQHPRLLDVNVQRLVNRHIHLVRTWAGRYEYEWLECNPSPDSKRSAAVSRPYKLPADVFSLYKSATAHTQLKKRLPLSLYVTAFSIVFLMVGVWYAWHRVQALTGSAPEHPEPESLLTDATPPGGAAVAVTRGAAPVDFRARVAGRPETAPAYDGLRIVRDFPRLAGCIESVARGCRCYTQQATVYPVPESVCRAVLAGEVFDPYASSMPAAERGGSVSNRS